MSRKLYGIEETSRKSLNDLKNVHSRRLSAQEDDYECLQVIGQGTFGLSVLWAAEYKLNKEIVMVRKIDIDLLTSDDLQSLEFEVSLSSQLRHGGILLFLSAFVHKNMLITVYPLYNFGSCYDILQAGFPDGMPELAIALILHEMLYGLDYLHKMTHIHRAVKASHILVASDGRVCLAGLRYCERMKQDDNRGMIAYSFPEHTVAVLPWVAPEILHQDLLGYDTKSDLYSVGITAIELHTGSVPFADLQPTQILLQKLNGTVPEFTIDDRQSSDRLHATPVLSGFSAESLQMLSPSGKRNPMAHGKESSSFKQMVNSLLKHSPNDRPTALSLQSHGFFKQLKRKGKDVSMLDVLQPLKPITDTCCSTDRARPVAAPDPIPPTLERMSLTDQWVL